MMVDARVEPTEPGGAIAGFGDQRNDQLLVGAGVGYDSELLIAAVKGRVGINQALVLLPGMSVFPGGRQGRSSAACGGAS